MLVRGTVVINFDSLYTSWRVEGSYLNKMLYCGNRYNYNFWVAHALKYLPADIFFEFRDKLAFYSTAERDACRVARAIGEEREIILLSERILPKSRAEEDHSEVRYFIFVVLHEVAHAVKKHRSPLLDKLTHEEASAQEKEADDLALTWFNDHVKERNNPYLKPLIFEEVEEAKRKNRELMKKLYEGV